MSIERAYPSGWGVGEKLTSSQANALDQNPTYALDRRAGRGDVLMSIVVATGTGRIISSLATGPDANTTFHPNGGNQLVRIPTLTDARAYTLGHTGATGGDRMLFYAEGTGGSPSGYTEIRNNLGTGLFRIGVPNESMPHHTADGREAEFIYNGSAWQLMRGTNAKLRVLTFNAAGTWLCPPGVYTILLEGYGGGGGGGGATPASSGIATGSIGGGGGGGAVRLTRVVSVVPGTVYTITIGAGGAGGAASTAGSVGGDTTFGSLATFGGAGGGTSSSNAPTVTRHATLGGLPVADFSTSWAGYVMVPTAISSAVLTSPGAGGAGFSQTLTVTGSGLNGNGSADGYAGGAGAAGGANAVTSGVGGGGGGGGGGGPAGVGGAGGAGGAGYDAAVGDPGTAGTAAAANTGAGGGGGGGGGSGNSAGGAAGAGAAGGSGKLTLSFVQ